MELFIGSLVFYFGAIIGSFLNVVIIRLPESQPLTGRSHCMHCGSTLTARELVPLFSYLVQRGKCGHCGVRFSPRYFFVELATGVLYAATWLIVQPATVIDFLTVAMLWFAIAMAVVVFVVDLEHYIILDEIIVIGTIGALALHMVSYWIANPSVSGMLLNAAWHLAGAVAGAAPFFFLWWISRGKWMGFGDVKLMIFLGSLLGLRLVGVALFLAIFSGGIFSVLLLAFFNKTLKSRIPFGVFLAPAGLLAFLYGEQILTWYLSLLGI